MECYCYLRNIQDLLSDEKTPYERRFGIPFNGPVIPFGAMVEYHPISAKDLSRLHQLWPKVLPGIFLGYVLSAVGIWCGDMVVADIEELEEMDASEHHARRLNAKEVFTPMKGENHIFPVADGTVKISGGEQDLKTSTPIRTAQTEEKIKIIFEENQTGLLQPHVKTHRGMMVKPHMIVGLFRKILFTVITWNPESNCTYRLRNHSLFH